MPFHISRYALAIGAAAALLAGCGGSQPPIGAPETMAQRRVIAGHADRRGSRMLPAISTTLIYAVGGCDGICILSYPKGTLVGAITGYDSESGGSCSDSAGNVYVSNGAKVVEFAHGGTTPTNEFTLPSSEAGGCSVDPKSGDLAVVYSTGSLAIFPAGSATPTTYNTLIDARYCAYDDSGNLFVSGYDLQSSALSELLKDDKAFTQLSLEQTVGQPGHVQWDGQHLSYESISEGQPTISRLSISGSMATVVGQTRLGKVRNRLSQSWIYKGSVIVAYNEHGTREQNVGIWRYPKGGKPTTLITKFGSYDHRTFGFSSVTVSVALH